MAVLIKRSSVSGKAPATTDLNYGELALNSYDGRLFMKANNGSGDRIVEITSATSTVTKTLTGGSLTLAAQEYSNAILIFNGTLTSNAVVTVPATPHSFIVVNRTAGNYTLTIKAAGVTPSLTVAQGYTASLVCDTTGVYTTNGSLGLQFSKSGYVSANTTTDLSYAGQLLLANTSGITITMPLANTYPAGAGLGLINIATSDVTVQFQGSDTSEVGTSRAVHNLDSFFFVSDGVSFWHVVWYSNPVTPTFDNLTINNATKLIGAIEMDGAITANGALTTNNNVTFNAPITLNSTTTFNNDVTQNGAYTAGGVFTANNAFVANNTFTANGQFITYSIGRFYAGFVSTGAISVTGANQSILNYTTPASLTLTTSGGTSDISMVATPTGVSNGAILFQTYDGTTNRSSGSIESWTEAATSSTSSPANIRIYTTPSGSVTKVERARFMARGGLMVGTTTDDGTSQLIVGGNQTISGTLSVTGSTTLKGITNTGGITTTTITPSTGVVMPDGYTLNLTPAGKNHIMNGDCRVQQRATASFAAGTSGYAGPDRFFIGNQTTGGVFSQAAGTITYNNISLFSVLQTVTTVPTSIATTSYFTGICQAIEGYNCFRLLGQPCALSFVFKATLAGTYSVALRDYTGANSYVTTFSYTTAGASQKVLISIPTIPTTLTTPNSTAGGMYLNIGALNTATYQAATLNSWKTGNFFTASGAVNWAATANNYISATYIQLENGTYATPYEGVEIGTMWNRCLRYYCKANAGKSFNNAAVTNTVSASVRWPVQMRVGPTVTVTTGTVSYSDVDEATFSNSTGSTSWYDPGICTASAEL